MLPIRTILHPTDFSKHADNAYRVARVIAHECDARLVVLHVAAMHAAAARVPFAPVLHNVMGLIPVSPLDSGGLHDPLDNRGRDPVENFLEDHAALRERLREGFADDGSVHIETMLEDGDAACEILRVAEERACDLIVMGTHGRTGLARLLMGSVAEGVMRRSRCPALTVRSPAVFQAGGVPETDEVFDVD